MDTTRAASWTRRFCHAFVAALFAMALLGAALTATRAASRSEPAAVSAPPEFADEVHVPQGCYISTTAFLARFRAEFPAETGRTLTVTLATFDGPHTIALVTWGGSWWGRDEYSGAFSLGLAVAERHSDDALRAKAETVLAKLASRDARLGRIGTASRRNANEYSTDARRRALSAAAGALPCPSEFVSVRCRDGDVRFLGFTPAEGVVAIYDPANGTATVASARGLTPGLVAAVAARLGYAVR